jgi:hypothetical protein
VNKCIIKENSPLNSCQTEDTDIRRHSFCAQDMPAINWIFVLLISNYARKITFTASGVMLKILVSKCTRTLIVLLSRGLSCARMTYITSL